MCKKSESISKLAVALVKANGEITAIVKDKENPHFKKSYLSLDAILESVRPILAKHGLAILQMPGGDGENVIMKTILMHESGEWLETEPLVMRPVKNDPQGMGSAITYARRYSLSALLSISTDEDDDGNASSKQPSKPAQQSQQQTNTNVQPTNQTATQGNTGGTDYTKRTYGLMNSMNWTFDDLQSFATDFFGREIRHLKNQVKADEWKPLYDALNYFKEHGTLPEPSIPTS